MPARLAVLSSLLASAFLVQACASAPEYGSAVSRTEVLSLPDTTLPLRSGDERISPLDLLEISVFGASDLDNDYQVDIEGQLRLPLVGRVKAMGLTASQLAEVLEERLGERYLQNPEVTVRISEAQKRYVTVDGSVKEPGMYPVDGQLTLLQAVALSGGPTDGANRRRVIVFRQIEGKRHAAAFDLREIRSGDAEDPRIYANDIVVMDGSEARRTYGDFLRAIPLVTLFVLY